MAILTNAFGRNSDSELSGAIQVSIVLLKGAVVVVLEMMRSVILFKQYLEIK